MPQPKQTAPAGEVPSEPAEPPTHRYWGRTGHPDSREIREAVVRSTLRVWREAWGE